MKLLFLFFVYLNPPCGGYNLSIQCIEQLAEIGVHGFNDTTINLNYFYDFSVNVDLEEFNYSSGSETYLNPTMFHGEKEPFSSMSKILQ